MVTPKYLRNAGKQWSPQEEKKLVSLADKNTPTRVIGLIMGRPVNGIYNKAGQLGVSLHPTNQKPYNRKKD